jgi:hypothetical protein
VQAIKEILQKQKTSTDNNCTTVNNKVITTVTTEQLLPDKNNLAKGQVDLIVRDNFNLIESGWEKYHYREVYRLGEQKYRELAKTAEQEGKNPARYFSWLLKNN